MGCSNPEPTQVAKDITASPDVFIDIFERIENFFGRLKTYTRAPMTAAMTDGVVKILIEVLGIFAIVTKEIKQGRASELVPGNTFLVADKYPEKYLKKLIGRRDIKDALNRLDRLIQEEARMATAQLLEVAHHFKGGVEGVHDKIQIVDDLAIEGTLITPTSRKFHVNPQ